MKLTRHYPGCWRTEQRAGKFCTIYRVEMLLARSQWQVEVRKSNGDLVCYLGLFHTRRAALAEAEAWLLNPLKNFP